MARCSKTFEAGHQKYGGRVKGTPNKMNKDQKDRIDRFFMAHWDEFEEEIWPSLTPKDKKDTFVALINYCYPKLTSVDVKGTMQADEKAVGVLRDAVGDNNIV